MGTGGNKNPDSRLIASVVQHLEFGLVTSNHEFGRPEDKPEKFRNTQESGVYLFKYGGTEFEVTFRVKK